MKVVQVIFALCIVQCMSEEKTKDIEEKNNRYYSWSSTSLSSANVAVDYYWRDYNGEIPNDAIEGGHDLSGKPTYIGQVYDKVSGLLPSIIYKNTKTARYNARGRELFSEGNVKILCAPGKSHFQWVLTKVSDMHLLIKNKIIPGGTESGHTLTIGRVNYEGEVLTGKVFSNQMLNKGLWVPIKNREAHFLEFEILTYNATKYY